MSTVTRNGVLASPTGYRPAGGPHALPLSEAARLSGDPNTGFRFREFYQLIADRDGLVPWRAETTGYVWVLEAETGQESLAYHWHADGPSHVQTPHLHLGAGPGVALRALRQGHLPTGVVSPSRR